MNSYSAERKESVLKKFLPPVSMTVAEVSKEEGISVQTLYYWRKQLKQSGKPGRDKVNQVTIGQQKLNLQLLSKQHLYQKQS